MIITLVRQKQNQIKACTVSLLIPHALSLFAWVEARGPWGESLPQGSGFPHHLGKFLTNSLWLYARPDGIYLHTTFKLSVSTLRLWIRPWVNNWHLDILKYARISMPFISCSYYFLWEECCSSFLHLERFSGFTLKAAAAIEFNLSFFFN